MESLALHRPVISTYVAGIPELIQPGETGWLVPASSVDALSAATREVLDTPAQLERMGRCRGGPGPEWHCAAREAAKLVELFRHGAEDPQTLPDPSSVGPHLVGVTSRNGSPPAR